jgi:Serine dehydrogenase proteinase
MRGAAIPAAGYYPRDRPNASMLDNHWLFKQPPRCPNSDSAVFQVTISDMKDLANLVRSFVKNNDRDLYIYNGNIQYQSALNFVELVHAKPSPRGAAGVFLTTLGGDAHSAYRMIRALRRRYERVTLYVVSVCKSAGTLLAIGSHDLVMDFTGELGPLDVQLNKPDELMPSSSGLDIFQALVVINQTSFDIFQRCMLSLIENSGGRISTKTAAELASDFAIGTINPITAQLDPHRLGEVQRAIRIAEEYADKLGPSNLRDDAISTLVQRYPSHGFVIDFEEASRLFLDVRWVNEAERQLVAALAGLVKRPQEQPIVMDLEAILDSTESKGASSDRRHDAPTEHPSAPGDGSGRTDREESEREPRAEGAEVQRARTRGTVRPTNASGRPQGSM